MDFKLINNTNRYFIHKDGYVFKVKDYKETIINIQIIRGVPKVKIGNQRLNIALLMIEYFSEKKLSNFKITYKIVDGKLPLKNIKIITLNENIEDNDSILIFKYKCKEKANAQNNRVKHISTITEMDVLNSLKRTSFKCFYCNENISQKNWHLDHVTPLSLGGLNSNNNITPSCKICNLMKGAIALDKFLYQIEKINKNINIQK